MATKIKTWVDGELLGEGYFTAGKFGGGWSKSDKFEMHLTGKYYNEYDDTSEDSPNIFDEVNIIFMRKPQKEESDGQETAHSDGRTYVCYPTSERRDGGEQGAT